MNNAENFKNLPVHQLSNQKGIKSILSSINKRTTLSTLEGQQDTMTAPTTGNILHINL